MRKLKMRGRDDSEWEFKEFVFEKVIDIVYEFDREDLRSIVKQKRDVDFKNIRLDELQVDDSYYSMGASDVEIGEDYGSILIPISIDYKLLVDPEEYFEMTSEYLLEGTALKTIDGCYSSITIFDAEDENDTSGVVFGYLFIDVPKELFFK